MHAEELYDDIANALAGVIEQRSRENRYRDEYWRLMSHGSWMNKSFKLLCDDAMGFMALQLPKFDRHTPIQEAVYALADEWVTMDLSAWVLSIPEFEQELPDDVYHTTKALADDRATVLRNIERMEAANSRSSAGRPSVGRYEGRSNDVRGGRQARPSVGRNNGIRSNGGLFSDDAGDTRNTRRTSGLAAVPLAGRHERVEPEEVIERPAPRPVRGQDTDDFVAPSNTHSRGTRTQSPVSSTMDGPDYTKSRPYDQFFIDGEEWQLAHKSKWVLTWEASNPFPVAFNPRTHMRFYVRAIDGTIREEHLPMSEGMRYASHEYQGKIERGQRTQAPLYERPQNTEGYAAPSAEEPTESQAVVRAASVPLDEVHQGILTQGSMEEAETYAEFNRRQQNKPVGVFHYARAIPISVDPAKCQFIDELVECTNLTAAAEAMNAAMEESDLGLWNFLNDRFTEQVNHAVLHRYGIKATISDFANDYMALITWMKDKKGENFARQFSQSTRYIMAAVASRLEDSSVKAYITNTMEITEEEYDANPVPIVVYEDRFSLMTLPFSSHELGIKITSDSQMVSDNHPKLLQLLEKFCDRPNAKLPGTSRYILTTDRLRIEVLQGGVDPTVYLVRKFG